MKDFSPEEEGTASSWVSKRVYLGGIQRQGVQGGTGGRWEWEARGLQGGGGRLRPARGPRMALVGGAKGFTEGVLTEWKRDVEQRGV